MRWAGTRAKVGAKGLFAAAVDGEPETRWVVAGLSDPVALVGGDHQGFTRAKPGFLAICPFERRLSLQQDHPFIGGLIVPLARRGLMPVRDDALHPKTLALGEGFDEFIGPRKARW